MRKQINNEWFTAEAESQWYIIWNNDRRKIVEYKDRTRNPHEVTPKKENKVESMATEAPNVEIS